MVALTICIFVFLGVSFIVAFILIKIFGERRNCQISDLRKKAQENTSGEIGEKRVSRLLNSLGGVTFNNYMIVDSRGNSHQIDHIYVSNKGIFVIETKNHAGAIYGKKEDQKWTQVLQYGKIKNEFFSPVKQNESHVYHISRLFTPSTPIYSCIVFTRAEIYKVVADNVFTLRGLKRFLLNCEDKLSDDDTNKICEILEKARNTTITMESHINSVKERVAYAESMFCQRCGGKLILRDGYNGKVYRCENYPNCNFTRKYYGE